MSKITYLNDNISLCYKNSCIHAKGQNANLIALGTFTMLLLIGISVLAKSN